MRNEATMRKAAVLVAILTPQEADRLLDQLTPDEAQRLRDMAAELGPIAPNEEERVLEDFFRMRPMIPGKSPPGLDLIEELSRPARVPTPHAQGAFRFLQDAEAEKLSRALVGERGQTIALVLSHLPAQQAGAVLVRLEPSTQVEVIRRLVDLEETDPEILHEVERALQSRLAEQVQMQRRRVAGLHAVAGILQRSPEPIGTQILRNLAARDPALADRLTPDPVSFDDLQSADSRTWAQIAAAVGPEILQIALLEASPALIQRVLLALRPDEADELCRRLEQPGPMRLSDVEEARRRVADAARRLALHGRIELARRPRVLAEAA